MVDCVIAHGDHTKLHQDEDAYHVVDCVVDGLNDLLLPVCVAITRSSGTVVHVIHVYSPEILCNSILYVMFCSMSQKLLGWQW